MMRIVIAALLLAFAPPVAAQDLPRAQAERLDADVTALARFGANADGGVDRVAYSDADIAGRAWAMETMRDLGLQNLRVDAAGNIFARRPGTDPQAKPIMFGSHIDSVPGGGNYDGPAGVLTAFEAIRLMNEAGARTKSPLDLVVFSNEEGGLVGSLAMIGELKRETLKVKSASGFTIGEGIERIGGDLDALGSAVIPKGALKAFLELHIEQSAILDEEDVDIGVVEGIVGIKWWDVTISGAANHAGTTPMNRRTDALVAAAEFVLAVNETALETEGRQVATVGVIEAFPGAPNVIPGRVALSLEIRDLDTAKMDAVFADIRERAHAIAARRGVDFAFEAVDLASSPALTDPDIRNAIVESAEAIGLSYKLMPSGAGHDAQDMAKIAPVGMIFVPSVGGISHSPKEFTPAQDLANGADVLARAILRIDEF